MNLLLSSAALPEADFEELGGALRRRAFAGLELIVGSEQAHGVDPSLCPILQQENLACLPPAAGVTWMLLPESTSMQMTLIWAAAVHTIGAGLLIRRAVQDVLHPARTALVHGSDPGAAAEAAHWAKRKGAATAWEIDVRQFEEQAIDAVLEATEDRLAHIRILGGGPEPTSPASGLLFSRLALHGYGGTVAVAPSSRDHLDLWRQWLLARRGWGCGTAAEKAARRQTIQQ